jgi:hypothetical protein
MPTQFRVEKKTRGSNRFLLNLQRSGRLLEPQVASQIPKLMRRRQLPAFEIGNPLFEPPHPVRQPIQIGKPQIDGTSDVSKCPQHRGLGFKNRFLYPDDHRFDFLRNNVIKLPFTTHTQLNTTNQINMGS